MKREVEGTFPEGVHLSGVEKIRIWPGKGGREILSCENSIEKPQRARG